MHYILPILRITFDDKSMNIDIFEIRSIHSVQRFPMSFLSYLRCITKISLIYHKYSFPRMKPMRNIELNRVNYSNNFHNDINKTCLENFGKIEFIFCIV